MRHQLLSGVEFSLLQTFQVFANGFGLSVNGYNNWRVSAVGLDKYPNAASLVEWASLRLDIW